MFINIANSLSDALIGIMFISLFPVATIMMNLGARYDFREAEKHYYSVFCKK